MCLNIGMAQLLKLHEARNLATLKTSRKANIIYGVKIIGFDSENGREYLPAALKGAIALYEGVNVNVDHPEDPTKARSVYDRIGKLINVRFVEGKGLYADLWLNPSHELTPNIFTAAEKMPDQYGLSHNAQGEGETKDGVFIVSKITEVRSVDLVADPATTKSLSESKTISKKGKTVKKSVKESAKKIKRIREEEEDDLKKKVTEALKESNDEDGDEAMADKIIKIFKEAEDEKEVDEDDKQEKETYEDDEAMEGDNGSDSEVTKNEDDSDEVKEGEDEDEDEDEDDDADEKMTEGEDEDDDKKVEEGRKHRINKKLTNLQEQVNHMRKTAWIRGVCRKIKLPLTRSLLEDLQGMKKDSLLRTAKRLALAHKVSKPKSGLRLFESKSSIPTGNDLYNWLQN